MSEKSSKSIVKTLSIGIILSCIIFTAIICAISMIFVKGQLLPIDFVKPITLIAMCISVFLSSFLLCSPKKGNGLVTGTIIGCCMVLITIISGLIMSGTFLPANTLTKAIAIIVSGCIGGILGVNKKIKIK